MNSKIKDVIRLVILSDSIDDHDKVLKTFKRSEHFVLKDDDIEGSGSGVVILSPECVKYTSEWTDEHSDSWDEARNLFPDSLDNCQILVECARQHV